MLHYHAYAPVWDRLEHRLDSTPDRYQVIRDTDLSPRAWRSRNAANAWTLRRAGPEARPLVRQCDRAACAPSEAAGRA